MVEESAMATALYRLAVLESQPLRTPEDLLEWNSLRKWVLSHPELLKKYKEQHYFSCAEEVTQNGYAPKKSSSIFSRFLDFIFRR
tara:strand:- start:86 stop:340 length:255 start_codon:yes stop_codon:yes gene_type:complete